MGKFRRDTVRFLVGLVVFFAALQSGAQDTAYAEEGLGKLVVRSEPLPSEVKDYVPEEEYTDEAGVDYRLESWELVPVRLEKREKKISKELVFEAVEREEEIPEAYEITAADEMTGESLTGMYPLVDLSVARQQWRDDFSFPVVFHVYDADYYVLGDKQVPYDDEKPQLEGCENELLALIGASPDSYRVADIRWDGEPYVDDDGVLCRNAAASGARIVSDYTAVYGGTAVFPEREAVCCEAVYSRLPVETEAASDDRIVPVRLSEMRIEKPEEPGDGWFLWRKETVVTVGLILLLAVLLVVLVLKSAAQKRDKGKKRRKRDRTWRPGNKEKGWGR